MSLRNHPVFRNLTPHPIVLRGADGSDTVIPPARQPARVSTQPGDLHSVTGSPVPFADPDTVGEVDGLPAPEPGVWLIVSAIVGAASPRPDVLVPGTSPADNPIRDEAGRIIAVTRLKLTVAAPAATETTELTWSNKIGSRGRSAWLLLVVGDQVVPFQGKTIPGTVVVRGTSYEKAGKWSSTTYRLTLAPGVRPIAGRDGWETGRFTEGLGEALQRQTPNIRRQTPDTWADLATALGVSEESARSFLRAWRPPAADAFDKVERELSEVL